MFQGISPVSGLLQLPEQFLPIRDGVFCKGSEPIRIQGPDLILRLLGKEGPANGGAVQGNLLSHIGDKPKRFRGIFFCNIEQIAAHLDSQLAGFIALGNNIFHFALDKFQGVFCIGVGGTHRVSCDSHTVPGCVLMLVDEFPGCHGVHKGHDTAFGCVKRPGQLGQGHSVRISGKQFQDVQDAFRGSVLV